MSSFSTLLGPVVSTKTGTVATSTLDGKYVGLYFSAHWCVRVLVALAMLRHASVLPTIDVCVAAIVV
jgi:hypothetical protein